MAKVIIKKVCTKCKEPKRLREFYKSRGRAMPVCKLCHDRYVRSRRQTLRGKEQTRKWQRVANLKKNFGLSVSDYNNLLADQNGVCAICKGPQQVARNTKHYCVDHDHRTGKIRGLLCSNCNRGLGLFGDDIDRLKAAVDYLS